MFSGEKMIDNNLLRHLPLFLTAVFYSLIAVATLIFGKENHVSTMQRCLLSEGWLV